MTVQQTRQLLGGLTVACLVGTAAAGVWAFSDPYAGATEVAATRTGKGTQAAKPVGAVVTQEQLEMVWDRPLRSPLNDDDPVEVQTKPAPPPQAKPRKPRANVKLIMTAVEPPNSRAMIRDASGKSDIKGEGEVLELTPPGLRIQTIAGDEVVLSFRGETLKLKLTSAPGGSGSSGAGRRRNNSFGTEPPRDQR